MEQHCYNKRILHVVRLIHNLMPLSKVPFTQVHLDDKFLDTAHRD